MPHDGESRIDKKLYGQVRTGAPPGTRTPNPRIKSPLLRISIHPLYQHLYASTLARYPQPAEAHCRPLTLYTAWYRDIRANMEQTRKRYGLDHCGRIITHNRVTGLRLHGARRAGTARAVDTVRNSPPRRAHSWAWPALTVHLPTVVLPCPLRPSGIVSTDAVRERRLAEDVAGQPR
jgi:hypothetical protein